MDQRGNSIGALTPGNTKLAWSCEISSIQELQDDSRLEIHPIWLRYENDDGDDGTDCPKKDASPSGTHLDHAVSISIHPDSSVTDLKHELLMLYDKRWNLESRRKDRYCLPIGWELVTAYSSDSCDRSSSSSTSKTLTVLGNHDFVKHTYNIPSDTIMYAVIQKWWLVKKKSRLYALKICIFKGKNGKFTSNCNISRTSRMHDFPHFISCVGLYIFFGTLKAGSSTYSQFWIIP